MEGFYVFKNEINNRYLGIDDRSGGYPYLTDGVLDAFRPTSLNKALSMSRRRKEILNDSQAYLKYDDISYFEMFPKETQHLKLVKVTMHEENI